MKLQTWVAHLQEQASSGLGIKLWCVREGITESSFHYWRKRLASPAAATGLIALPMVAGHPESMLELRTPHGYFIPPVEPASGSLARWCA